MDFPTLNTTTPDTEGVAIEAPEGSLFLDGGAAPRSIHEGEGRYRVATGICAILQLRSELNSRSQS